MAPAKTAIPVREFIGRDDRPSTESVGDAPFVTLGMIVKIKPSISTLAANVAFVVTV
jgi:hypothetical protein